MYLDISISFCVDLATFGWIMLHRMCVYHSLSVPYWRYLTYFLTFVIYNSVTNTYVPFYLHTSSVFAEWIQKFSNYYKGYTHFIFLIEIVLPKALYQYLFLPTSLAELPHPLPYSSPNYFWDENDIPVFFSEFFND